MIVAHHIFVEPTHILIYNTFSSIQSYMIIFTGDLLHVGSFLSILYQIIYIFRKVNLLHRETIVVKFYEYDFLRILQV